MSRFGTLDASLCPNNSPARNRCLSTFEFAGLGLWRLRADVSSASVAIHPQIASVTGAQTASLECSGNTFSRHSHPIAQTRVQISNTDRIFATIGPALSVPICKQFFRPSATSHGPSTKKLARKTAGISRERHLPSHYFAQCRERTISAALRPEAMASLRDGDRVWSPHTYRFSGSFWGDGSSGTTGRAQGIE